MTKSKSSKETEAAETPDEDKALLIEKSDHDEVDPDDAVKDGSGHDVGDGAEVEALEDNPIEDVDLVEDAPEQAETQPVPQAAEPQVIVQKTGFMATLTAGVLAAGAGFLGAQYSSQSWPFEPGPTTDPLAVAQAAKDSVDALQDRLATAEAAIADQPAAVPDLSGIEAQLNDFAAALTAVQDRVTSLEAQPASVAPAPTVDMSGVENEIEGLQSQVAALVAEANVAEQTAAAAAQAQLARAALARVMANLETGAPFADALSELQGASDIAIPDALASVAPDGVPTLSGLQDTFDPAARAALAAARAASSDDAGTVADRLGSFLRARTGARSVEPREGDDPDAILSRVGASIDSGNITDALAEAEALPEQARSAMTDWLTQAETRQQALVAADALSQELNSN